MGEAPLLRIDERDIRRHGPGRLLGVCWRQWRAERALARRGVRFRTTDVAVLAAAYAAMSDGTYGADRSGNLVSEWRQSICPVIPRVRPAP